MRAHTALPALISLAAVVLSSQSDSWNSPFFEVRDLETRNDQYIMNLCPEFLGLPKPQCGQQPCGRDSKTRGVCDNIRLNGLQDQRCRFAGGCGDYCLCVPQQNPGYAQVAPAHPVQFIGIMCPEQYGLPKQKCSDPKCGGDTNYTGYCNNKLVSGAQGPGCGSPGCGIYCDCDNSPGPPPSVSWTLTANTTWLSGTATLYSTWGTTASVSMTQPTLTPFSLSPSTAGLSSTLLGAFTSSTSANLPASSSQIPNTFLGTSSTSSEAPTTSPRAPVTSLSPVSSESPDMGLITQTGPIWEPTVAPGPITSGGMIIPIIPIIPPIPPPAGFVPPPPETPEPTEQCPADYQETECGKCGGEYGWCQHPPNQGCPCQDACTAGYNMPDCNDSQCEGEENKCTIGPQKDCECKPECPTGIDGPRCDDPGCEGVPKGQCTTGQYAGCDCIGTGTYISESEDFSWAVLQQGILNLMAINAPNGAYSSLLGMATALLMPNSSTSTASAMISMTTQPLNSSTLLSMGSMTIQPSSSLNMSASSRISTTIRQSNSSTLTANSATITTNSPVCYTLRSYTICQIPEATVIDGHTTTEIVTTTLNSTPSQAATTSSPTCYTVRSYTICKIPEATVIDGHTTTEIVTKTLDSASPSATTTSPTCYTVRSYTICQIPEVTVLDGHTTTEMMTTTLGPTSPQSSSSSPVITPPAKPTGPMYGVYIALWSNTESIPQPNGLPPQFDYEYNDLVWVSAVPATASDNLLTGPQYCVTHGVDSTIIISHIPTINQLVPYPTASITSLRPSGTSGPSCDWIPSPNNDEPGSLSCDVNPTSVDCEAPLQAATTCGSVDTGVEPLVQCIWQGG